MAAPTIDTTSATTHYPVALGSGSLPVLSADGEVGIPTAFAPPDQILYLLTNLLWGHTDGSAPDTRLRERPDTIGTWLCSTDGMILDLPVTSPSTYARALDELKVNLGVTLTYIAQCLSMQRSAVYRWYEGRSPHAGNRARLQTIREFATKWRKAGLPSLRQYWETVMPDTTVTLGSILSSPALDVTALDASLDGLIRLHRSAAMPTRTAHLGFSDRRRDRRKTRERLSVLSPTTSHEHDENGPNG